MLEQVGASSKPFVTQSTRVGLDTKMNILRGENAVIFFCYLCITKNEVEKKLVTFK